MRIAAWFIGLILCTCALTACSRPEGGAAGSGKTFRIAVVPKGTSHDFWYSVRAGVEKADSEFDDVEVTWKGPLGEGDTNEQIAIVEGFVADGYDGICVAPLDAIALRKPIDQAIKSGVPIVIFDSGLEDQSGIVSYVATNNYRGGQRAGEYLAELLGGKGKLILMRYDLNSQSTEQREQGFLDAVKKHPNLELLSADKYAGADETHAIALAENLLSNFGDEVQGIFCPNQSTASGMFTVLRRAGLTGKVKFVGFDSGENLAQGLAKGEVNALVLQDPVQMGYDTVRVMREHLLGQKVPERVETAEELATTENANDPKIHALLYPDAVE